MQKKCYLIEKPLAGIIYYYSKKAIICNYYKQNSNKQLLEIFQRKIISLYQIFLIIKDFYKVRAYKKLPPSMHNINSVRVINKYRIVLNSLQYKL